MVSVMDAPETTRPQKPPQPFEPAVNETEKSHVMVDVREVDFAYSDNKVLHNISLQMPPRAVTAFIGPSGCGKTTLLRCINRMNDLVDGSGISKGEIHVDGVDINMPGLDVVDLRRRVGMKQLPPRKRVARSQLLCGESNVGPLISAPFR